MSRPLTSLTRFYTCRNQKARTGAGDEDYSQGDHGLSGKAITIVSSSTGWYLYAAVAAEIVLLVWGLQAFVPARIVFPVLAVCVAALDLYGTHALLMPYYTGLTSHVGNSVPATLRATLTQLPIVFDRLVELRPPWLNATALVCLWVGYWIGTAAAMSVVVMSFRKPAIDA